MAEKHTASTAVATKPPKREPPRKFEAPQEDLSRFGVVTHNEEYVDGFVTSDLVRELLDVFGLEHRTDVVFPFQHMKRLHGEIWSMRIEPAADRVSAGAHARAHHWTFKRDMPERVSGAE